MVDRVVRETAHCPSLPAPSTAHPGSGGSAVTMTTSASCPATATSASSSPASGSGGRLSSFKSFQPFQSC
eukprot:9368446-Alexandrium_andersonii.AAC.1